MMRVPQVNTSLPSHYSADTLLSLFDGYDAAPRPDCAAEYEAGDRQPQILLIGDDPALQYSRRKVLESDGYLVASARSNLTVEEIFLRDIKLVLLCHAIPEDARARIVGAFMRLAPQIPVLQISPLGASCIYSGATASIPARPAELLCAVSATLSHH